jgi:hypothetical protein
VEESRDATLVAMFHYASSNVCMHHPSLLFSLSMVLGLLGLDVFDSRKLRAGTFFFDSVAI